MAHEGIAKVIICYINASNEVTPVSETDKLPTTGGA
jgi:hypothetical protein